MRSTEQGSRDLHPDTFPNAASLAGLSLKTPAVPLATDIAVFLSCQKDTNWRRANIETFCRTVLREMSERVKEEKPGWDLDFAIAFNKDQLNKATAGDEKVKLQLTIDCLEGLRSETDPLLQSLLMSNLPAMYSRSIVIPAEAALAIAKGGANLSGCILVDNPTLAIKPPTNLDILTTVGLLTRTFSSGEVFKDPLIPREEIKGSGNMTTWLFRSALVQAWLKYVPDTEKPLRECKFFGIEPPPSAAQEVTIGKLHFYPGDYTYTRHAELMEWLMGQEIGFVLTDKSPSRYYAYHIVKP